MGSRNTCAGEVKDPVKTFPRALAIVVLLVVANYMLPIMAFTAVDPDWAQWTNGIYVDLARKYGGPVFGGCIALGQCISVIGLFENALVHNTFTLCGMSEQVCAPLIAAVFANAHGAGPWRDWARGSRLHLHVANFVAAMPM